MRTKKYLVIFCLLSLVFCGFLFAQTPASRAHIRVNAEAAGTLRQANDAVAKANWIQAASLYQKAVETYAPYVVPLIEPDGRESATLFQGARYAALEALRDMPPAGRRAYQQLFDAQAKAIFNAVQTGSEPTALVQLVNRYLFSSYSEPAITILTSYYLEKGDLYNANRYLNIACWFYPKSELPKPIQSNLALMEKLSASTTGPAGDWPTYGGDNSRNAPARGVIAAPPKLISSFPDDKNPLRLIPPPPDPNVFNPYNRPYVYNPEIHLPYFPVIAQGRLYLPSAPAIYAFDINSVVKQAEQMIEPVTPVSPTNTTAPLNLLNQLTPAWRFEIPKEDAFKPLFDDRIIHTAASADKYLYLPLVSSYELPEKQLGFLDVKYPFPNRTLFCFNTATGKIVWSSQKMDKVSFSAAPAVESGVLYVAGISMPKQTDLPEHYVYCLDAATGAIRWSSFIASGLLETNLFNNPSREPVGSAVTVDKDTVYYCSHIGVVAALDKYDGAVKWVTHYPQHQIPPVRQDYTPHRLPLQWINNPVVATSKQLIVTPIDSPYLLSLSAEDGKELWRWAGTELGGTRYVLGAANSLLVVSGMASVSCLNIDKQGKREWVIYNKPFRGKGVIARDRVYIPCLDGLIDVDIKTGKITNSYLWAKPQHCGNLILTPGYLITASASHLNLFSLPQPPASAPLK